MSPEYKELLEEFRSKKREILSNLFREQGQQEAASLVMDNYEEYRRRRDEGRRSFISHDPLDPFVAQVISGGIGHSGESDSEQEI